MTERDDLNIQIDIDLNQPDSDPQSTDSESGCLSGLVSRIFSKFRNTNQKVSQEIDDTSTQIETAIVSTQDEIMTEVDKQVVKGFQVEGLDDTDESLVTLSILSNCQSN